MRSGFESLGAYHFWRLVIFVESEEKILISGVGRSGTTFLVHLLTACGLDTGYDLKSIHEKIDETNSGLEWPLTSTKFPTIVKSPGFCIHLPSTMYLHRWKVKHMYISFRHYEDIAEHVINQNTTYQLDKQEQVRNSAYHIGVLMGHLIEWDIPYTFIKFPQSVDDPQYAYEKLKYLIPNLPYKKFELIHKQVADRNKIHYG